MLSHRSDDSYLFRSATCCDWGRGWGCVLDHSSAYHYIYLLLYGVAPPGTDRAPRVCNSGPAHILIGTSPSPTTTTTTPSCLEQDSRLPISISFSHLHSTLTLLSSSPPPPSLDTSPLTLTQKMTILPPLKHEILYTICF